MNLKLTILLAVIALIFLPHTIDAQSKVDINIHLLSPDLIAEATLDKDPFFLWVKEINEEIERQLQTQKEEINLAFIITMHKDKAPSIDISYQTALDEDFLQGLYDGIAEHELQTPYW